MLDFLRRFAAMIRHRRNNRPWTLRYIEGRKAMVRVVEGRIELREPSIEELAEDFEADAI